MGKRVSALEYIRNQLNPIQHHERLEEIEEEISMIREVLYNEN